MTRWSSPAGSSRLPTSSRRASIPTAWRANGPASSRARWPRRLRTARARRRSAGTGARWARGAWCSAAVGPVGVGVGLGQLEDVGLERAGDEHGDAEAERRDLLGQRLAPALERALGGRVGADAGMPRIAPWLETSTIRPRPAARIAGSSSWVSRTGPKKLVEKICSHVVIGHLLEAADAGDTGVVHEAVRRPRPCRGSRAAAAAIDAGSSRSSRTPTSRGSSAAAPVAPRSRSRRRRASASRRPPSTRAVEVGGGGQAEAARRPVTTTLRASAIAAPQRPPSAGGSTSGRPSGCALCHPAQIPGKYGPGWPSSS